MTTPLSHFDYLITGAGAAGLSLAWHLNHAGLGHKRILMMDRERKLDNDRTWCFWEARPGPFEMLVARAWDQVSVHVPGRTRVATLAPYRYKMIRGGDFFAHMYAWLDRQPNISFRAGNVSAVHDAGDHVTVCIDGEVIRGELAFNSILPATDRFTTWARGNGAPPADPRHSHLLQHFLGWEIETPVDVFDEDRPRLMDFCVPQENETRFVYVMPFSPRRALVEFTVFGASVLERAQYEDALRTYIGSHVYAGEYQTVYTEFGVIPMTDAPAPPSDGPRVVNIGTAGGLSKPSTGYTFTRMQRHAAAIARALAASQAPRPFTSSPHSRLLDAVLLDVLANNHVPGSEVFMRLFERNPASRVLRFLDEDCDARDTLALMSTVQIPAFSRALLSKIRHGALR